MQWLSQFFDNSFMPHGHCLLWRWDLLLMHVGSDVVIGLSYLSIAMAIYWLLLKRGKVEFSWMLVCFCAFIFACAVTHVVEIVNIWNGLYYFEGIVKVFTALISGVTAVLLWPIVPKLALLPSFTALNELNLSLKKELDIRELEGSELLKVKNYLEHQVERRTCELESVIIELKKTITEKESIEQRLSQIMNSVSEGIISVNTAGNITSFNKSALNIFGYSSAEFSRLNLSSLIPEELKTKHEDHFKNYMQHPIERGMSRQAELFGVTQKGRVFPVEVGLCPIQTPEGRQVIASIVDVS